jgi:hypothetical protein
MPGPVPGIVFTTLLLFLPRMRVLPFAITLCLLLLASSNTYAQSQAPLYQESMMERYERMHVYDQFLIEEIRKFPDVKAKEKSILKQSNGQRFAVFIVSSNGFGTYNVKMQESFGKQEITHMMFNVDSASGKIHEEKITWKN